MSKKKHHQIERHDGPIVLPKDLPTDKAIVVLQQQLEYDNEKVAFSETIPCFIWDGAIALQKAIDEMFGIAMQMKEPDFLWFEGDPPKQISVEIAPGKTVKVPWGRFKLNGIPGYIETATTTDEEGLKVFQVRGETTHAYEDKIQQLLDRVRYIATHESIYRGRAFELKFKDGKGNPIAEPKPKFLRLSASPVIFKKELEHAIEVNLLTPIRHTAAARLHGIPLKRGALLAGPYGTGKTLTAAMVAREAVANGWTYIYVHEPDDLADALRFAQRFQPAVVFAEDVDRVATAERTDGVNELLNTLDGIGSKADEIITILSSNHAENINAAMRRPGRIDIVLSIEPPDAEAAMRLIRHYGKDLVAETENLTKAGEMLAGQIPAVIREVVERSKLEAIRRTGGQDINLIAQDIVHTAEQLKREQVLFAPKIDNRHPMEHFGRGFASHFGRHLPVYVRKNMRDIDDTLEMLESLNQEDVN